jgi:hypothetical protein
LFRASYEEGNFLETNQPCGACVTKIITANAVDCIYDGFKIIPSESVSPQIPMIPPDLPMCEACKKELNDPFARITVNDGRQTPWRGHPVFRAQHACACCCRGCLFKWQQIPPDRPLSAEEVERLADLLMAWISRELVRAGRDPQTYQVPHTAESSPSSSNKTRKRKRAEAPGSRSAKASFAEPSLFDEV